MKVVNLSTSPPYRSRSRLGILALLLPAFLVFLTACAPVALPDPQGGAGSLLIGGCEFHWLPRGGAKKGGIEIVLEELVSGGRYQGTTDVEGHYFISNAPPGVYMLSLVKFNLSEGATVEVEYEPDVKLFYVSPGKVHYQGRMIVEVDKSDIRRDFKYYAYEKFIAGDLRVEEIKKLVAARRGNSEWLQKEISPENELERF
ncbi:MAG: hypothetical protein HYY20_05640 [Candidatus Tectomicrobia bacterium]|uniref:Carboxypeptidase regulatory-like domain-containing protein n=1 Tax=Tectimicrobiota bacterium TaxID=2528274 RepID=A0A932CNJ6_UNCTE|nr:hypothetical protein [Candidatus Tectomicrobia bacterium]